MLGAHINTPIKVIKLKKKSHKIVQIVNGSYQLIHIGMI